MALRDELLGVKAENVEHVVDGKPYTFRRPRVEAQHRVLASIFALLDCLEV